MIELTLKQKNEFINFGLISLEAFIKNPSQTEYEFYYLCDLFVHWASIYNKGFSNVWRDDIKDMFPELYKTIRLRLKRQGYTFNSIHNSFITKRGETYTYRIKFLETLRKRINI